MEKIDIIKEKLKKIILYYIGDNIQDRTCLGIAYIGVIFFTGYHIWSINTYGFADMNILKYTGKVISTIFGGFL